ncbi:MAG: hypothetical protein Q9161_007884 [Pseudevernia consocians]
MVSSGVWAGEIPIDKAYNLQEVGGGKKTLKQELERIGYLGAMESSFTAIPIAAHFELHIGSTNTVPGKVQFSLDIRAGEDDRLMMLEHELKVDFEKIAKNEAVGDLNECGIIGRGCHVEWTLDAPSEAIKFDEDCIRCVDGSARELFGDEYEKFTREMISGAGQYDFPSPRFFGMSSSSETPDTSFMTPILIEKEQLLTWD